MSMPRDRGLTIWHIAALATAGTIGTLAVANWLSNLGIGEPPPVLDGKKRSYSWNLGEIAYTVKGHGEPLILIHGIYAGASSYEFRRVFDPLARDFRVYALDLLGFGHSDRPAINYTPAIYVQLIGDFVRQVVGGVDQPVSILASSLTAALTIRVASRSPGLFSRLILIEPTGIENLSDEQESLGRRLSRVLLSSPLLGQTIYNVICSRPSIRYLLQTQVYANPSMVSDDMVDIYRTMARQPGGRFPVAGFISGSLNTSVAAEYSRIRQPILLCWGKDSRLTPLENAYSFRSANAHADLRIFDCGSIPQDEVPDEFTNEVKEWMRTGSRFTRRT
ncbi:MAG: alpha/beta fold hydrolase [Ktedonobacterales bacterium]